MTERITGIGPTELGKLVVFLSDLQPPTGVETAGEAAVDARDLAKAILNSDWLRQHDERVWDQALLTAADKLPAPLQLAGEFLRGMVAGGANPYRTDAES